VADHPADTLAVWWAYRAEVEQARNIKTYLNANVVEIDTNIPLKLLQSACC